MEISSFKKCVICKGGTKNDCLHWHVDPDTKDIWVYCVGKCKRGYSLYTYCYEAGLSIDDFLKNIDSIRFKEANPNEVNKIEWPYNFIPLSDPRATLGVQYIIDRGLKPTDGMYYDYERSGIVFPYYYGKIFVGAQTRFIKSWIDKHGDERKMDTLFGTRLGLLFYNYNQVDIMTNVKGFIITEGAFDTHTIQQATNDVFGGPMRNPWRAIACSGSGATAHHIETLNDLKSKGYKIVIAFDADDAGVKGLMKFIEAGAATHAVSTENPETDWNECYKNMGSNSVDFVKWFMRRIENV